MPKMFQIRQDDLADLERIMAVLCEQLTMREDATPLQRVMARRVKKVLSDVRWNYGPPEDVTEIPAGDSDLHDL